MKNKIITIFGSALPVFGEEEYSFAYQLGYVLGKNGFVICNGGFAGTMEASHKGAADAGAHTIGITVDLFNRKPNQWVKEEIKCNTLFERINKLINIADGIVVLKGGTGTLLELAAVWEMVNKTLIQKKPVIAYKNFWSPLIEIMDKQMITEKRPVGLVKTSEDVYEICNYLTGELDHEG